jgi:hypothetical protein
MKLSNILLEPYSTIAADIGLPSSSLRDLTVY